MEDIRIFQLNQEFDEEMADADLSLNESLYKGLKVIGLRLSIEHGMTIKKIEELMGFYCQREDYSKCAFLRDCIERAKTMVIKK
jgi:hypothetical protein